MRTLLSSRLVLQAVATVLLLAATPAFADQGSAAAFAAASGVFLIMLLVFAAGYVYVALALQKIAQRTNVENGWWAWIPILQIILMLNIAKKPAWWIILFFIPLVGIIFGIITWMGIAEAVKKPNWWGILVIVPGVNLVVPGYLAWSE